LQGSSAESVSFVFLSSVFFPLGTLFVSVRFTCGVCFFWVFFSRLLCSPLLAGLYLDSDVGGVFILCLGCFVTVIQFPFRSYFETALPFGMQIFVSLRFSTFARGLEYKNSFCVRLGSFLGLSGMSPGRVILGCLGGLVLFSFLLLLHPGSLCFFARVGIFCCLSRAYDVVSLFCYLRVVDAFLFLFFVVLCCSRSSWSFFLMNVVAFSFTRGLCAPGSG